MQTHQHFIDRFNYVNDKFKETETLEDVEQYQLFCKEYSLLKPIVDTVTKIRDFDREIEEYSSLLKTAKTNEDKKDIKDIINSFRLQKIESNKTLDTKLSTKIEIEDTPEVSLLEKKTNSDKISFERVLKKIASKNWDELKINWVDSIPDFMPIAERNNENLSDLYGFDALIKELIFRNEELKSKGSNPTIVFKGKLGKRARSLTLEKGLYLLHKASHIISAGQLHARQGLKTWSLSSSYQGALLAARAIIALLGHSIEEIDRNSYILDCFGKGDKQITLSENEIYVDTIHYPYRIEHKQTWEILKRLLRSYKVDIWPKEMVITILDQDISNFSFQRNTIHYWNNSWIFDDLHNYDIDLKFGVNNPIYESIESFELKSDYSLSLSLILLNMGILLVNDLSKLTNKLKSENELFNNFLFESDRHPMYVENFSMVIKIKPPSEFDDNEIDLFEELVKEGSQVNNTGLRDRILNSKLLAFCYSRDELVGISSIKQPNIRYKNRIFEKANIEDKSIDFDYELGYSFTKENNQGKGISHKINSKLISSFKDGNIYSTTANPVMIHLLKKLQFNEIGKKYKGEINEEKIQIFSYYVK